METVVVAWSGSVSVMVEAVLGMDATASEDSVNTNDKAGSTEILVIVVIIGSPDVVDVVTPESVMVPLTVAFPLGNEITGVEDGVVVGPSLPDVTTDVGPTSVVGDEMVVGGVLPEVGGG